MAEDFIQSEVNNLEYIAEGDFDGIKIGADGVIDDISDFIYIYCQVLHLREMDADRRARFDKIIKANAFAGDQKWWPKLLDKKLPNMSEKRWKELYDMFQDAFENMEVNKENWWRKDTTTRAFFDDWYGEGKMFQPKKCSSDVDERIKDFANFLEKHRDKLLNVVTLNYNSPRYTSSDVKFDYDDFVKDLKAGKYTTNGTLRDRLLNIVDCAQGYAEDYSSGEMGLWGRPTDRWPKDLAYDFLKPAPETGARAVFSRDTQKWFTTEYNAAFPAMAKSLFTKLLTSSASRGDFPECLIKQRLNKAIEKTDFDNKDNPKNYITPKIDDRGNPVQRLEKAVKDFKKDHFDPWTDPIHGQRVFFSQWGRDIFDTIRDIEISEKDGKKRKLKPTDGLQGLIDNKQTIIDKLAAKSPKGKEHFEWLAGKLEEYSKGDLKKAVKNAFVWPSSMQALVSRLIVDAIADSAYAKGETALEIISSIGYGIFTSRVVDALAKSKWDFLSNDKYSFNKNGIIKTVLRGTELTMQYGLAFGGRMAKMMWNGIHRGRIKFGNKKTADKFMEKAHKQWQAKNGLQKPEELIKTLETSRATAVEKSNTAYQTLRSMGRYSYLDPDGLTDEVQQDIDGYRTQLDDLYRQKEQLEQELSMLEQEEQFSGSGQNQQRGLITSDERDLNSANRQNRIIQIKQQLNLRYNGGSGLLARIEALESQSGDYANIEEILKTYKDNMNAIEMLDKQIANTNEKKDTWNKDNLDKYYKLLSFWNTLNTYSKVHQFKTLIVGRDAAQEKFLEKGADDKSMADKKKEQYINEQLLRTFGIQAGD